jgi:histidyl-tRNA synthetase
MMIADTMEELGLAGNYVVKVNNRKVLDGVLASVGLHGEQNAGKRLTVLRAFDKLDRLGIEGVRALLGVGRKDESGDFTKGANLDQKQITRLIEFLEMGVRASQDIAAGNGSDFLLPQNRDQDAFLISKEGSFYVSDLPPEQNPAIDGWDELTKIRELTRAAGYRIDRIRIDPSVVRGLEYYTGPVFEVELTFPIEGDDGKPVRFGSVAGGGRYDGLVGRFRGDDVPATGISIGVSRLMAALQHLNKIDSKPEAGPVVVTVFDQDRIADYQKMVATLRSAGIRAELYLGSGKFGAQMKYADKRGSPCAVIQGGDEKAKGEVQIKDLILGATISSIKDREEYKAKQAEAQFAVPEDHLLDGVRRVLTRHGVKWE